MLQRRGFTLVELIISIALIALIVAFMMPLFVQGFTFISRAGQRSKATYINQAQIENVLNINHKSIVLTDYPDATNDITITFDDSTTSTAKGYVLNKTVPFQDTEVEFYFFHPQY